MTRPPLDIDLLQEVARSAMTCNICFENSALERSYVDLPQPRYVGPGYSMSSPRVAWIMINPGAGSEDLRNRSWRARLLNFREKSASLEDVFAEQRAHMPHWNKLMPFIELHGLDTDKLALVNIAWCATAHNQYRDDMLQRCWERHSERWLAALAPEVIILSGRPAQAFRSQILALLPRSIVYDTFHYAYWSRPTGRARSAERAISLRRELGL